MADKRTKSHLEKIWYLPVSNKGSMDAPVQFFNIREGQGCSPGGMGYELINEDLYSSDVEWWGVLSTYEWIMRGQLLFFHHFQSVNTPLATHWT